MMRKFFPFLALLVGCSSESPVPAPNSAGDGQVFQSQTAELTTAGLDSFKYQFTDQAVQIAPNIYQSRSTANANLVVTPAGNVLIDTGLPHTRLRKDALDHKALLDAVSDQPVKTMILTHAHGDHYSNAKAWADDEPQIVAHYEFEHNQDYLADLLPYLMPRNQIFYPNEVPDISSKMVMGLIKKISPRVQPDVRVSPGQVHRFELGGVQFEVIPMPGAEGADGLVVWLPQQKILFTGDLYGHIFGMWPNLTTMRGERPRYPRPYIESLNRVLALEPEIIIPSHFYPVKGKDFIRAMTTRIRDAVAYVDEAVIEGMNEGRDMYALMREVKLPPELQLSEVHGKVSWGVRSIWEAYQGWFYQQSATEMYAVPVNQVYPDLVELSGGGDSLLNRARDKFQAGELEKALHLSEVLLSGEPGHQAALSLKRDVLKRLLERAGHVNHHETMMLEHYLAAVEAQL